MKAKNLKKLGILALTTTTVGSTLVLPTSVVSAHALKDGSIYGAYPQWDSKDPHGWQQNDPSKGIPINKKGSPGVMYNLSNPFPAYGCMIFSYTFIGLKAGLYELGTTPADVHDQLFEQGAYNAWGFTDYAKAKNDVLEFIGVGEPSMGGLKKAYDDGYFVIIRVNLAGGLQHDIALDYVKGSGTQWSDFHILDSGNWGNTMADKYNHLVSIQLFKSKKGLKGKDSPKLQEHRDGNLKNSATPSNSGKENPAPKDQKDEIKGGGAPFIPNEADIPNMPKDRDWKEFSQNIVAGQLTPEELEALNKNYNAYNENPYKVSEQFEEGSDEAQSIAKWKEERDSDIAKTSINWVRRWYMGIGIFVAFSAGFFLTAYVFDRFNPTGFSILEALTKGKFKVIGYIPPNGDKFYKQSKQRILTDYNVMVVIAVLSLVSIVILSGWMYNIFAELIRFIMSWRLPW